MSGHQKLQVAAERMLGYFTRLGVYKRQTRIFPLQNKLPQA